MGENWTDDENRAIVASYFEMLDQELTNQSYSKTEFRRALADRIDRSHGSIEYKYQNISGVLWNMHAPYIDGYKPARNYQSRLESAVADYLTRHRDIPARMEASVLAPAAARRDIVWHLDKAPTVSLAEAWHPRPRGQGILGRDYVQLEESNRTLGEKGELAVLEFEQQRLVASGAPKLAERVEHISKTRGDGLGYDVLSFEVTGKERLIEVKTTRRGVDWPMFISRNEVDASQELAEHYYLYRVYEFSKPKLGLYQLHGAIRETCDLDATVYAALPISA